jgi:hypothetical protein
MKVFSESASNVEENEARIFFSHWQMVNNQVKSVLNCTETILSIYVYVVWNIQNRCS